MKEQNKKKLNGKISIDDDEEYDRKKNKFFRDLQAMNDIRTTKMNKSTHFVWNFFKRIDRSSSIFQC